MKRLENKNIVLTGASSGIGQALLKHLSVHEGVKVIAVARNIKNIVASESVFPFSADLSTHEGVDKLFAYAKDKFGIIDLFIANAGFAYIEEMEAADWTHLDKIYSLNTTSVIYSLLKLNDQSKNAPVHFVCTISAVAFIPLHAYALYCSSKAALHQFIEGYRQEKKDNLAITAIYPIATKTSFFDHASGENDTPTPWPQQDVEVVARKIIRGIEKRQKRVYPSLLFRIFYPIGRTFPLFISLYTLLEKRKTKQWLRK